MEGCTAVYSVVMMCATFSHQVIDFLSFFLFLHQMTTGSLPGAMAPVDSKLVSKLWEHLYPFFKLSYRLLNQICVVLLVLLDVFTHCIIS